MILAVTGHRPNKLGGYTVPNVYYNSVMEGLDRAFLELRPTRVRIGMALGVDQWAAELCHFNGIPFDACIPCDNYASQWPVHSQIKYRQILQTAASIQIISPGPYASWKMQRRNEWMVDNSECLVAVWDGSSGGTANCVRYAQSINRRVHRVSFRQPEVVVVSGIQRTVGRPAAAPVVRPAREALRELPVAVRNQEESPGTAAARAAARRSIQAEEDQLLREARDAEQARIERRLRRAEEEALEAASEDLSPILLQMLEQVREGQAVTQEEPERRRRRTSETSSNGEEVPARKTKKQEQKTSDVVAEFGRLIDLD